MNRMRLFGAVLCTLGCMISDARGQQASLPGPNSQSEGDLMGSPITRIGRLRPPTTVRLATRESFLLAGVGPAGAEFPAIVTEDDGQPHALLEMWLRTTPGQAAMLQMMANC